MLSPFFPLELSLSSPIAHQFIHALFFLLFPFLFMFLYVPLCISRRGSVSSHGIFPITSIVRMYARFRASKIGSYPRRVGRIKWKENIWTRISACSMLLFDSEPSSSRRSAFLLLLGERARVSLNSSAKCNSIGDEIGADQASGKLRENRDV